MAHQTDTDTIAAVATPPGAGGIGVVRISGPQADPIAQQLTQKDLAQPRFARLANFLDDQNRIIDQGLVLRFPGPNSFTGEDVVELQGHGGPVVMNLLLKRCVALGARLARPGEFSERAFLNDKLDLAQAEAIADLIHSGTETAVRAAQRSLEGEFSSRVNALKEQLIHLRMYVESAIDFPDEEIDFLGDGEVARQLADVTQTLHDLRSQAQRGQILRDGIKLALVGKPNAGKSSLLNALAGKDAAIVTEIAGTTRDVLREHIQLDGIPIELVDTAGLRHTEDVVEREGVRRARSEISTADHVLVLLDATDLPDISELELPEVPTTFLLNKIDLVDNETVDADLPQPLLSISAKRGDGIDALVQRILEVAGVEAAQEGQFLARTRHLDALDRVAERLAEGKRQLEEHAAGEILAEELRLAQQSLSDITGEYTPDDLLGEIFSSFCIGK